MWQLCLFENIWMFFLFPYGGCFVKCTRILRFCAGRRYRSSPSYAPERKRHKSSDTSHEDQWQVVVVMLSVQIVPCGRSERVEVTLLGFHKRFEKELSIASEIWHSDWHLMVTLGLGDFSSLPARPIILLPLLACSHQYRTVVYVCCPDLVHWTGCPVLGTMF